MDHDAVADVTAIRIAKTKAIEDTWTDAERHAMRFFIVELVVNGGTIQQAADHFAISHSYARSEYQAGLAEMRERTIDEATDLRDEVTLRQRELILSNMPRAKAGDRSAAQIVQNADLLLAGLWGLRSLPVARKRRPATPAIAEAVEAYVQGVTDAGRRD